MKHTQGKWRISNLGNLYGFKDCIVSEVKDETYPKYTDSPTKINVIATMQYWNKDENKANANLIANAPEMLTELKLILDKCRAVTAPNQHHNKLMKIWEMAEKAIDKAEGK